MTDAAYDVAIVGAGIVGAACAEGFARRGMRVAIVDRDFVGGGATAAGMGHIVVMDDSEAQFALTRYSQRLWQSLRPDLPDDVEDEMAEVRRKHLYYGTRGVPTEVLGALELKKLEPNLREGMVGGLLVPEDAVLYPPCAARFLVEKAQQHGAALRLGKAAVQAGRGVVGFSDGSKITAGLIVNAGGAWAADLMPGVEVKKRKGHLVITDR